MLKNLLSSQLVPVYPGLQVHVYPASLSSFLHVPPFKHGLLGKHASSSITPKPSKLFQDMLLLVLWWNYFKRYGITLEYKDQLTAKTPFSFQDRKSGQQKDKTNYMLKIIHSVLHQTTSLFFIKCLSASMIFLIPFTYDFKNNFFYIAMHRQHYLLYFSMSTKYDNT